MTPRRDLGPFWFFALVPVTLTAAILCVTLTI